MAVSAMNELPNEVLQQILFYLPASSVPALLQVSRKFNDLAHPLLWRYHCRTQFKFWNQERHMEEKFADDVAKVDWKSIFSERHHIDLLTSWTIDSILSSQTGRTEKYQRILDYGYDTKDTLLRHLNVGDEAEDVLARRYYSGAILGCVHRARAINEWVTMMRGREILLERALAAFDMFILHGREGDFEDISARLDDLAKRIDAQHPGIREQSPRQKAFLIVSYLRAHGLLGLKEGSRYHDLQNNFISIALQHVDHPSLPLISVAIYCCIAKRLGLDAQPCGCPFHVLAVVRPASGFDMDGNALVKGHIGEPMYMDPYESNEETPAESLLTRLRDIGTSNSGAYMNGSSTADMVLRTGRNIMNSVHVAHQHATAHQPRGGADQLTLASDFPDTESAFYGALWASMLLGMPPEGDGPMAATMNRRQFLPYIIQHFETHFPTDVSLIERYLIPLFRNSGEYTQLVETIRVMRDSDAVPKQVKPRTKHVEENVRYKVGQVFQHKRYDYEAVITGWDVECGAGEQWMAQMRIHELTRGRHQSFYHVLVEDKSVRYVAEENIEIVEPDLPHNLMLLAGRHFKRWDKESHRFISNIKDEYPDD